MIKAIVIDRKKVTVTLLMLAVFIAAVLWYWREDAAAVSATPTTERSIQLVTGEFKSTGEDGKPIEVYRWDPGTVHVSRGETVKLHLYGVNGVSHSFEIEGLGIKGNVQKGKETVVTFRADKAGTYRLICHDHKDLAHNGPMIGYIVVD